MASISDSTRRTVNVSMPPDMQAFVIEQANKHHGENISHYIRTLISADMVRKGIEDRVAQTLATFTATQQEAA